MLQRHWVKIFVGKYLYVIVAEHYVPTWLYCNFILQEVGLLQCTVPQYNASLRSVVSTAAETSGQNSKSGCDPMRLTGGSLSDDFSL